MRFLQQTKIELHLKIFDSIFIENSYGIVQVPFVKGEGLYLKN